MTSSTMTVRLSNELKTRLEKLAEDTHRSKSFLAAIAINEYLEIQEWQVNEIKVGMKEADSRELVDHSDVVKYWERKRAYPMGKGC